LILNPQLIRSASLLGLLAMTLHGQTLAGAIDMHAHTDPDGSPRSIDALDLARMAR
jgi:hypothetical protein